MTVVAPMSVILAMLIVFFSGPWARADDSPIRQPSVKATGPGQPQSALRALILSIGAPIPPPLDHPQYPSVKALIERHDRCAAEAEERQTTFVEANNSFLFLTAQERWNDRDKKWEALQDARGCETVSLRELTEVALPELEKDCRESKDMRCAEWAHNQRIWTLEVKSIREIMPGCAGKETVAELHENWEKRYASQMQSLAQEEKDQEILRRKALAIMMAEGGCRALLNNLTIALKDGLSGRDKVAEIRARAAELTAERARETRAEVQSLVSSAQTLIEKGRDPQVDFGRFRVSCDQFTKAVREISYRKVIEVAGTGDVLRTVTAISENLEATEDAWEGERAWDRYISQLIQERDATPPATTAVKRIECGGLTGSDRKRAVVRW